MIAWHTRAKQVVLSHPPFLVVEMHEVELPDGRVIPDWPWIVTPEFATVVAVTPEDRFLVFRQTKYAIDGVTLAPVGGLLEPGEDPLAGAQRELLEETGCTAPVWHSLGDYAVDANRGAGRAHLYLARDARRVTAPSGGDLEAQELLSLTRDELEGALASGQFKALAWSAAVALSLLALRPR